MTPTHSDLNLTAEGLTGVTDTELHALEPHSYYCTKLLNLNKPTIITPTTITLIDSIFSNDILGEPNQLQGINIFRIICQYL